MSECGWDEAPGPELLLRCLETCSWVADSDAGDDPGDLVDAMTAFARFEAWAVAGKAAMISAAYDD
jgi:hypothetical protein